MPPGTKIVVQASHGKVVAPPHRHVVLELQHIEVVAATAEATAARRVRLRHVIPYRLNCGTDSQASRIECGSAPSIGGSRD